MIIVTPFLLIMLLALFSSSQAWKAKRDAQAIAAEAARIGVQPSLADLEADSNPRVSGESLADAAAYIARQSNSSPGIGTVTNRGVRALPDGSVEAQVEVQIDYHYNYPGLPGSVQGVAVAEVVRGVTQPGG